MYRYNTVQHKKSGKAPVDSLKKLAAAVFVHALVDAQKGCPEALEWLLKDDSSFPFWCRVYGAKPTSAREELCKAIKTAPVKELAKELRHERITQALTENPELGATERLAADLHTVMRRAGEFVS